MGLPMYRPPEDDLFEDAVTKVDKAAAARRSTIRRETSARLRRDNSARLSRLIEQEERDRAARLRDDQSTEAQIEQLQEELERLRRMRRARRQVELFRQQGEAMRDALRQSGVESSQPNADAENTTVEPWERVPQNLPRPPRESNLRFEIFPNSFVTRSTSPWRYRSIPSPPYSSGSAGRDRTVPDGPVPEGQSSFYECPLPALTEGFAPANVDSTGAEDNLQGLETPPPETWESSYPPLRRVGHLSPRPVVDGLGDRRRSPSPLSDAHEEETWTNLMTTMGGVRSSTTTSFASTQHSESNQRSGRSSQATSFGEIGSTDDTRDLDLPPGITEEDVMAMRARYRPGRGSRMTGARGLREHQDRLLNEASQSRMLRAILDRIERDSDVPDEWWADLGLPHNSRRT